jgi:hypothetical protein
MKRIGILMLSVGLLGPILLGRSRIKLDVKTKFSEKFDLKGIKYGTMHQLEENGFEIVEFGEDYCVWLKDYSEEKSGKEEFEYKLLVALTAPSAVSEKPAFAEREISGNFETDIMTYQRDDNFLDYMGKLGNYFVASHRKHIWESLSDVEKIRAYEIGRKAAKEIQKIIKSLKVQAQ